MLQFFDASVIASAEGNPAILQAALDEFKRVGDNSRENLEAEKEAKTEN